MAASRTMASLFRREALVRDVSHAVLDHDDRTIDHEAEVDRAEAHQAAGDAHPLHHRDREEHRQRNHRRHDQPRPEVPEKGEQNGDDQDGPLEEVLLHGLEDVVDQVGSLVNDVNLDVLRQKFAHILHGLVHGHGDVAGIFSHPHEDQAENDLPLALSRRPSAADGVAEFDVGNVPDADGDALDRGDDDIGDLVDVADQADPLNEVHVAGPVDRPAADVLVVLPKGLDHFVERQMILGELHGLHLNLVLLGQATQSVDLRHARHASQAWADHPVLHRP